MKKIKSYLVPVGFLLVVMVIASVSFGAGLLDKDECWDIGDQMAEGKPDIIAIPTEEAKSLFGTNIDSSESGTIEVGTAAYYHFKCHK